MLEIIERYCRVHSLIWGVCDAKPLLAWENQLGAVWTPFVRFSVRQRLTPENAASILVVGLSYGKACTPPPTPAEQRLKLSANAIGEDYHITLGRHLKHLAQLTGQSRFFVDTGPLNERALAFKAGIGKYGKNCKIISIPFGTLFNIGYVMMDVSLHWAQSHAVPSLASQCAACDLCIQACPGGALRLNAAGIPTLDAKRCVSYLTQKKGGLTAEEAKIVRGALYGCDICSDVCPCNAWVRKTKVEDSSVMFPDYKRIAGMDDADFKRIFGGTAAFWRGKTVLQRNARLLF